MDFSKLNQLGRPVQPQHSAPSGSQLTGIVKVKTDGYQPDKIRVRARLGERMFTAEFLADDLVEIERDPQVESVSLAEVLPLQKLPGTA